MSLYLGPHLVAHWKAGLFEEAATERLASMARESRDEINGARSSAARRVARLAIVAVLILGATAVVSGFDLGGALHAARQLTSLM